MKKSIILSLCAFVTMCLCASVNAQTVRRVNNTPGLNDPNVYATAQAAHDAAVAGDIISLEPSTSPSYGSINVLKRINIVGPGYFLDKNPSNFFDKRQPYLDNVTFGNGSANSTIMGVHLGNSIDIRDANILVTRCLIWGFIAFYKSGIFVGGVESIGNNATISNSLIANSIGGNTGAGANCVISNNIIMNSINNLSIKNKLFNIIL